MGLKLIGEVALDGSGFERGLNAMASSVKGFIAGAFGLYGIETMIRKTVDTAKELVTESKRLGIGVEQLQVLKQAAKENSTELGTMAKAFEKLDVAREKALSGSKEGMKLLGRFAQLGISQSDLKTQTAANLFMGPMRDKAASMSQEDLGPILREVIGKGFGELIPVLKTDFEELEKKMRSLGSLMDTGTAVKLKILEDEFSLLGTIIATKLGPKLLDFAELLFKVGAGFAASWAWLSSRFSSNAPAMQATMSHTPGFGGWAPGESAKTMSDAIKAAAPPPDAAEIAKQAGLKTFKEWTGWAEDMRKRFAALEDDLKHPAKPNFNVEQVDEKEKKEKDPKQFHEKGDALIKVGNFLGSSKSGLEDIGQKQVQLLQQIANNTRPSTGSGSGTGIGDDDFPMS